MKDNLITIAFYEKDIFNTFTDRESGKQISAITIPYSTNGHKGYVWFYPTELININSEDNNSPGSSFNPKKRWIRVPADSDFELHLRVADTSTRRWSTIKKEIVKAKDLKEEMKHQYQNVKHQQEGVYC